MSGGGDVAQAGELAAAVHRLAALADRIRDLRARLTGGPAPGAGPGERPAAPEAPADAAKGDAR